MERSREIERRRERERQRDHQGIDVILYELDFSLPPCLLLQEFFSSGFCSVFHKRLYKSCKALYLVLSYVGFVYGLCLGYLYEVCVDCGVLDVMQHVACWPWEIACLSISVSGPACDGVLPGVPRQGASEMWQR